MSYNDDLIIYTKIETFLDTIYPRIVKFPSYEKFRLAEYITLNTFELMKCISLANSVKSKRLIHLQEADGYLQLVKSQVRFAKRRKYISKGFYDHIDERMTEISKMLKGYIMATVKK